MTCVIKHFFPLLQTGRPRASSSPIPGGQKSPTKRPPRWGPSPSHRPARKGLQPVPCVFLEADLTWGGQGQDGQHGEQREGEALVGVPGLRGWRGAGQQQVAH